jgi:hypothetical protein
MKAASASTARARAASAGGRRRTARNYDARVAGRWTSILVSLAAAMLLIVLIDGWAIAFLPRVVEKIVISAAFIMLVVVAVQELKGRDRQRA